MKKTGLLIVISGFSGVGKGTLVDMLLKRYPEEYSLSISATTREPKDGEKEGVSYFYKTREEFERMIADGLLLEYAVYNDDYYGTPADYVLQEMNKGKNVILEIEVQGGLQIKEKFPGTMLLYIVPPSAKELMRRLVNRGRDSMEDIMRRMRRSLKETEFINRYDKVLVNDDLETSFQELRSMILSEQDRINALNEYIEIIREELLDITKGESNAASIIQGND